MLADRFSTAAKPTPRRIPEPFLRAEIASFPLASEESFRAGIVELDRRLADGDRTRELWRACEGRLAPHTGWSLDRLVAARDRGWFGPDLRRDGRFISLHDYLRALVRSHCVARAGVTEISESTELTALDAADHYRWLTLSLPEDLLLSALGVEPAPVRVALDPPLLVRRLLDLGLAEIHQHVNAGMDFPLLWASALAAIATPDVRETELASPGAPFSEGRNLVRWLLVAAIARCVLAEYLIRGSPNGFRSFVVDSLLCLEPSSVRDSDRDAVKKAAAWTPRRRETLVAALHALIAGDDKLLPDIEPLRDLYADMHPEAFTLKDRPVENADDVFLRCDPVAARLALHGWNAGERWFLRNAFARLDHVHHPPSLNDRPSRRDECFLHVFWQTIRIRCQYYRTVVQRPLTGGLQWFIRFYGRLGRLRDPLGPVRAEVSYRVAAKRHRIRVLELRTSIADTAVEIGEEALGFLESWKHVLTETSNSMLEPEMGLLFHFVKDRDEEEAWSKGVPAAFWAGTFTEPEKRGGMDVTRGRYAGYYANQCRKARALAELIAAVPSCLWFIRGLDVAKDELGIPTWVLVPLFRHLVDESARASPREQGLMPLKVTVHTGEDFRHLLEGMRRIYEQVHYILGGAGGRLGHAISLGVDPQAWAESVGSVLMPAEERLWDLVWEWRLYTKYKIKPGYAAEAPAQRVEILLNQVRELSDHIYGRRAYRIEDLAEVHHVLHSFLAPPSAVEGGYDTFLRAAQNVRRSRDGGEVRSAARVARILERYLDDEDVFRRGQTIIDVSMRPDEVAALNAVQHALRRGIAQRGIVVEINPSSNLLIGDLLDLRNHPILRLNPPVHEQNAPPPVAIAVGSDDPLTFSTELLHEYTLLHQAACAAGHPERVVQEWLESIRRTGMDARFTLAWRPSAKEKVELLIREMRVYLQKPPKELEL